MTRPCLYVLRMTRVEGQQFARVLRPVSRKHADTEDESEVQPSATALLIVQFSSFRSKQVDFYVGYFVLATGASYGDRRFERLGITATRKHQHPQLLRVVSSLANARCHHLALVTLAWQAVSLYKAAHNKFWRAFQLLHFLRNV